MAKNRQNPTNLGVFGDLLTFLGGFCTKKFQKISENSIFGQFFSQFCGLFEILTIFSDLVAKVNFRRHFIWALEGSEIGQKLTRVVQIA